MLFRSGEQLAHLVRADLVELVDGAQLIARLLAQAEDGEKTLTQLVRLIKKYDICSHD